MNYSTQPFRTLINFSRIKLVVNPNGKSTSMTTWSPPFSIHDLRSNINNLFLFHPAVADRPPQLWNQIPVRITLNDGAHHLFFRNSHAIEYTQTQINPWSWSMTKPVNFSFGGLLILQDIPKSNHKHTQRLNPKNHFSKHSHGAGNFFYFLLYILQGILTFPRKNKSHSKVVPMNHWHSIPIIQDEPKSIEKLYVGILNNPSPQKHCQCQCRANYGHTALIHNEATQGAIPAIYQISHEIVMHTAMTFPLIQTMSASFLNENIPTATDGLSNSLFHSKIWTRLFRTKFFFSSSSPFSCSRNNSRNILTTRA